MKQNKKTASIIALVSAILGFLVAWGFISDNGAETEPVETPIVVEE